MARRSDHTREEIKAMAITEGIRILAEEGIAEFSARKVAKAIGYTIGTIYNVFTSHDELMFYLNAETLRDIRMKLIESTQQCAAMDPEEALIHLAHCYIDYAHANYNRFTALFEYHTPQDTTRPAWYLSEITALLSLLTPALSALLPNQNQKQITELSYSLWAAIHGICQLSITEKLAIVGAPDAKNMASTLISHLLNGARAHS